MSLPRPTLPYSDEPGEKRRAPGGAVYEVVQRMPHRNGDPAYLRVRSEKGGERTIYACDWSLWRKP